MPGIADAPWDAARALVAGIEGTLGPDRLVGAYVYGSLVHDAFVESQSDIDLLVLLDRDLSPSDLHLLRAFHEQFVADRPAWEDRIEVQYLRAAAMWDFRSAAIPMAAISPGEPFHATAANPDWLQNWYDVRESGVALRGPAASRFIPPIAVEEFVSAIRVYVAELRERVESKRLHRGSLAYIVFSMCRARFTCASGEQISKQAAMDIARVELPAWGDVLDWASTVRIETREKQHAPATPEEHERVVSFVREQASLLVTTPGPRPGTSPGTS